MRSAATNPFTGRIRVGILLAIAAALLLVPTAQAQAAEASLEVQLTGGGEGTVSCEVGAGPLEECEAEYEEGTEVSLIAEPEEGSEFAEWRGLPCDEGTEPTCTVTISEDLSIEAVFELEEFELTIETEGEGEGIVECQVDGGSYEPCPESESYPYETAVTLFAEAEVGSEFLEWEGDCSGIEAECELVVEEALSVTAVFVPEPPFELTIETAGTGSIDCEVGGEECEAGAEYEEGTQITLFATAAAGSEFVSWSGCDSVFGNECEVEMNADRTVTASFKAKAKPEETCATNASLCPPPTPSPSPSPTPPAEAKCLVPKLAKKTLGQAKSALRAAHCALGKVTKPKKAKGTLVVKSSKPGAGTSLAAGAKVNLKLGPKPKKKK